MADVVKYKSFGDKFVEALERSKEHALTEADCRELSMIGRARYQRHLKEKAAAEARRKAEEAEKEKLGIRKVVDFPGK